MHIMTYYISMGIIQEVIRVEKAGVFTFQILMMENIQYGGIASVIFGFLVGHQKHIKKAKRVMLGMILIWNYF